MNRYNILLAIAAIAGGVLFTGCAEDNLFNNDANSNLNGNIQNTVQIPQEAEKGELLVKFVPEMTEILDQAGYSNTGVMTRSGIPSTDVVLSILGAYELERVFPENPKTEDKAREAGLHLWYIVRFDKEIDLQQAMEELKQLGEVSKVQCNSKLMRANSTRGHSATTTRSIVNAAEGFFDDPGLPLQWGYNNTGSYDFTQPWAPAIEGADINCLEAWEKCTGDPSIIVAVMDEGVMWNHPDLMDNMWVNEAETLGSNIDADGNGYKGDRYGYNFATNNGMVNVNNSHDTGHGTHVAGTIAAVNGNGIGVSSIAGGNKAAGQSGVKIMSCQLFSGPYGATLAMEARAMKYAADNGAVILQCSWGYNSAYANILLGFQPGPATEEEWAAMYPLEKEAIDYFIHNAGSPNGVIEGGLVIFASGNEFAAIPAFPGAYSECICVAAVAADYTPSSYTDYGKEVDLSAPGGDGDYYGTPGVDGEEGGMIYSTLVTNGQPDYGYYEGTSMACPHVSGVAALGLSYAAQLRKHYKASEFKELLINTGRDLNQYYTGIKKYNYFHSSPGSPTTQMELASYRGKMGKMVDADALLRAIEDSNTGAPMRLPNIYVQVASANETDTPDKSAQRIDLSKYFLSNDVTTYSFEIGDINIATATLDGTILTVTGLKTGTTTITVTVGGKSQTVSIIVRNSANQNGWM